MSPMIKVYTASKRIHAEKLRALEPRDMIHFNARWLDTANLSINCTKPASKWQVENFDDIISADYILLYGERGDVMQGALIEAGFALAHQKIVYVVMDFEDSDLRPNPWMLMGESSRYSVRRRKSVEAVLEEIKRAHTLPDTRIKV